MSVGALNHSRKASISAGTRLGFGGLEVDAFAPDGSRNYLHGVRVGAFSRCLTVISRRLLLPVGKSGVVPFEQPVGREGRGVVLGGVQGDGDDAVHVGRASARRVDAEPAGYGGADLFRVEDFSLDGAGPHNVVGEGVYAGFLLEVEPQGFHTPSGGKPCRCRTAARMFAISGVHRRVGQSGCWWIRRWLGA